MTLDHFPLDVVVDEVRYPTVRLMVTPNGQARVFGVKDGQIAVLAAGTATEVPDNRRAFNQVNLDDGTSWQVIRSGGCGCGHPLKRTTREALYEIGGLG